jgi:aldose 1-epimerase
MAVVTEVGATLRAYESGGTPVCWGFAEDEISGGGRGQVLAPWPNRLRDGRYEFEGISAQVPLDEPHRSNAIHGLVRWVPWSVVERDGASITLGYLLHPQPAYPFRLALEMTYRLGPSGLTASLRAQSRWHAPLPYGAGFHPYLWSGPAQADGARLALPARERLLLDDRALPTGKEPVEGTPFAAITSTGGAVAEQPLVGALRVDDCFTALEIGDDGRWVAELVPSGHDRPVTLWADAIYRYIMCFTGDTLAEHDKRRGIAIEPMTCPPDALRTGEDLVVVEPGGSFEAAWGIVPADLG